MPVAVDDVIVLAGGLLGGAVIIYTALSGARRRGGAEEVLGRPLQGLARGPIDWGRAFKTVLPGGLAPEGFEGEWRCVKTGCGSSGCTYACRRPSGGGEAAFKVAIPLAGLVERGEMPTVEGVLYEAAMKRFLREVEALSRVRHPHVLTLLGYSRKIPLVAYELAEQGSLAWQVYSGWRPTAREAAMLGAQLAHALAAVHSAGMVHGDVKPSNVLFTGGVAKLGDFGSVRGLLFTATQATAGQHPQGTPGWRAPEQVFSDIRARAVKEKVLDRIDVYQLGATLLYALTGETLDGEDAIVDEKRRKALEAVEDRLLRRILARLLEPRPWRRPTAMEAHRLLLDAYYRLS